MRPTWLPAEASKHVPSGYLTNASHYGLTREAAAAVAGLASVAMTDDVDALAEALKAKSVEGTLARHTAEFACSLLAMAKAHERPDPDGTFNAGPGVERKSWLSERMLFDAGRPGAERKPSLAERMPAYVRRATVDCALSAGWVCIATLATVDPGAPQSVKVAVASPSLPARKQSGHRRERQASSK